MSHSENSFECSKLILEINKLKKINRVLVQRVERSMDLEGDSYALFQTAIVLEAKVQERTASLEKIVSSLNQANDALTDAKEKAEQAVQAKSKFLARMSHELRTPLNAILGYGQLMQGADEQPLNARYSGYLDIMLNAGAHLLELINEVLDLAKIDAGKMSLSITKVDASIVIDDCLALLKPVAAERNIEIIINAKANLSCLIQADTIRLRQVLINLLTNAIKYNREGGKIHLGCDKSSKDALHFSITDEGNGIPAGDYSQIFEPFERLNHHAEVKGSGIGLAVCKQLIELMGGKIGVESQKDHGSTFWFELPLHHI